ncbi:hypothetical protein GWK08_08785 [Leptobacterium flavescens]|uniref:ParB/Sulfiredoxin domain-containing protein n=1 Tax=Leptobacterium flavescens TaxID=472055 RepID=A0A6P0UNV5_9FLAO|nr:hypothetical protein [Leptobacterium flavescens]NER13529.1 hypothetical protein [Leptobacterium flavescens]
MQEITLEDIRSLLDSGSLELIAIQREVCLPILQRIYRKMKFGIKFENIRVNNSRIVDGHHRYICSILSNIEIGINDWPISSTVVNYSWNEVIINEEDYESQEMILEHNNRDAELNNVDVSVLNDLVNI